MNKASVDNNWATLIKIFQYLNKGLYKKAESVLITSFYKIISLKGIKNKVNGAALNYSQTIYYRFNEAYLSWIREHGGSLRQEINKLHSPHHDNFLLAHCQDMASLDDLLYELILYLTVPCSTQRKEIEYHVICYKKLLRG
jgi:hypothetical protein